MNTVEREIWDDFNLEKNCVAVTGKNEVRLYLAQLSLALRALAGALDEQWTESPQERRVVNDAITRLRETFRILGLKHFYPNAASPLKIDTTDSGFFHFSTLLDLAADVDGRDTELFRMPGAETLERDMLRYIVEYADHPCELQARRARRLYLDSLDADGLVRGFQPGPLVETGETAGLRTLFWSFFTYDKVLNRPFVYLIHFVCDDKRRLTIHDPAFVALRDAAESSARGRVKLLAFSRKLDAAVAHISPRIVKRLIIGPYWSPSFTENDGPLGTLLDRCREGSPFALRWETETVISGRETRVARSLWRRPLLEQVFWLPRSARLRSRGVSHLERCVMFPYWLAQHVEPGGLFADHREFAIDTGGRIHAIG